MLLAVAAACGTETVEIPGETVVVEKEVIKTVEVPGETVVKEVIKEVQVPGETVVVEKVVTETVEVPGETVVVKEEVVKTVEVPGETVTVEVVKEVMVPGETVVVEKEVVKTVEVPGQTVVVTKEVAVPVEVVREVPGKNYVTDPTTGKAVTAPEYGGTLTYPYKNRTVGTDPFLTGHLPSKAGIGSVNERLAWGDWGIARDKFDFRTTYLPDFAVTGNLAESWETPDDTTIVFNLRQGVHYALDPDSEASRLVGGRELTADDVVYSFQRNLGTGEFTEPSVRNFETSLQPLESIQATDKYTVVFKLTEPKLGVLRSILQDVQMFILPREVIDKYGDYEDWRNVVGTGPIILKEIVEGVSKTHVRNPDYWGYDEKYPENRLPYIDQLRGLFMEEEATYLAALRTGKVDIIHGAGGGTEIKVLDTVRSLQRTNPEIQVSNYFQRSDMVEVMNVRKPPFDDIRVRRAMQMALDLETINDTYFGGFGKVEPMGGITSVPGFVTPFEEWPEEIKGYYTYDPAGAEALLDAAGLPRGADGVRLKVTLDWRDAYDVGYAEIATGYWADIGVDVETTVVDTPTWVSRRAGGDYEMSSGNLAFPADPAFWVNFYGLTECGGCGELVGGIPTPELTAAYDAFQAATTIEEQVRAFKKFDGEVIKQHYQVWGPITPLYQVNQPWVKGFNGEFHIGNVREFDVLVRLWIDQDLKQAMGY